MTQSFFIPGPLPGMNDFAGKKTRWHYKKLKADWQATIRYCIKQALLQPMVRADVKFRWIEKGRRRDPDNITTGAKFVLDALVAERVLPDDGWDEIASLVHEFEVARTENPGVFVMLRQVA